LSDESQDFFGILENSVKAKSDTPGGASKSKKLELLKICPVKTEKNKKN